MHQKISIILWSRETHQISQEFTALSIGVEMTSECSNVISFHSSTQTLTMFIQDDGITIRLIIQFCCVWRLTRLGGSCLRSLCRSETTILEHYGISVIQGCTTRGLDPTPECVIYTVLAAS